LSHLLLSSNKQKLKIIISAAAQLLGITEIPVEQIRVLLGQTEVTAVICDPSGSKRSKTIR